MREPPTLRDPAGLAEAMRVDRRAYTDPAVFEIERERLFARAWLFAAHESELRSPGEFVAVTLAGRPALIVRQADGGLRGFRNRCPHRGAILVNRRRGHIRQFQCPYHGWSFRTDGGFAGMPAAADYEGTAMGCAGAHRDLTPVPAVAAYRGFVFARLAAQGPGLVEFLGPLAGALDNMVERSPAGELEVFGGMFRMVQRNNWKVYFENFHDGPHALPTHKASIDPAKRAIAEAASPWSRFQAEVVAGNSQPPDAMAALTVNTYPRGHSDMMQFRKNRPASPEQAAYEAALASRVGREGVERILSVQMHNAVIYPGMSMQPGFMQVRAIVPLAVDRTRIDVRLLRMKGAPDWINERTVAFANAIHSPASLVRADDLENYDRVQRGLSQGGDFALSVHRGAAGENAATGVSTPMSERFIRNQFAAWRDYMGPPA
jgi:phenylpropionate dioxygenase-like ring-hydroxylating dioxygenase large terminal subunit